jgi:hypothetical protein
VTTERDVYDVDTSSAVDAFKDVADAATEAAGAIKEGLTEGVKELGDTFAKKVVSLELYIEGVKKLAEFAKESVQAALEEEAAQHKLTMALQRAGDASGLFRNRLLEQAEAIEKTIGVQSEHTMALQAMLAQMRVAPQDIEGMTEAAYRLSRVTGQDATAAARLLARAMAEGKDELKKWNIEVDDAEFKQKGFKAVIEAVMKQTVDLSESVTENERSAHRAAAAWDGFKKALGGIVTDSPTLRKELDMNVSTLEKLTALIKGDKGAFSIWWTDEEWKSWGARGTAIAEMVNKKWHEINDKTFKKKGVVELGEPTLPGFDARTAAEKKAAAEQYQKEVNAFQLQQNKQHHKNALDAFKKVEEEDKKTRERIKADKEAQADYEKMLAREGNNALVHEAEERARREKEIAEKAAQHNKEIEEKKARDIAQVRAHIAQTFEQFANNAMQFGMNLIMESLMANTKYNRALQSMAAEREVMAAKELGIVKSRAQAEQQLADEARNAQAQRIADFLAGVAKEAGMKALVEAAAAIASAASYDYGGAAMHAAAAAAFAAVGVAAGGAAVGISSSRGMTTEERHQLESMEQQKKERAAREASQDAAAAGSAGDGRKVEINNYFLGLPGMTTAEMGQEIERLQSTYDDLKTGNG